MNEYVEGLGRIGYLLCDSNLDYRKMNNYFTLSFYSYQKIDYSTVFFERISFHKTSQQRDIALTRLEYNNQKYVFINVHLESCSENTSIRKKQLKEIFQIIQSTSHPAIVGGDLNIRDKEAKEVLKEFSNSISDVCLMKNVIRICNNDNNSLNTWFLPFNPSVQCRFDRIYVNNHVNAREVGRSNEINHQIHVFSLEIIGNEEMPWIPIANHCPYRTLSDHRGLLCIFDVNHSNRLDFSTIKRKSIEDEQKSNKREKI